MHGCRMTLLQTSECQSLCNRHAAGDFSMKRHPQTYGAVLVLPLFTCSYVLHVSIQTTSLTRLQRPKWEVQQMHELHLAGVVVWEVQLGILGGDCGQQEGPPLLANAVMVVRPVCWRCLHKPSHLHA